MGIERLKSWEGNGSDGVKVKCGSVEVHTGEENQDSLYGKNL